MNIFTSMPTVHLIIGIDPGPATGICILGATGGETQYAQISYPLVCNTLELLVDTWRANGFVVHGATEKYVVGFRSARTSGAGANKITREVDAAVQILFPVTERDESGGIRRGVIHRRNASTVKQWATDKRLEAAGLEAPRGMRHAKDAARHALYCAVHDLGVPDPLSKRERPMSDTA